MTDEIKLSDDQLSSLARQIVAAGHACRFDDAEAKSLHRFAQSIENGGWAKWTAILDFGATLIQMKKAGTIALVGIVVTAAIGAMWAGFRLAVTP
jgi:hypothetical protein